MLENEGFNWDCYVDIFDGGPTVTASTDQIRTIRDSVAATVAEEDATAGPTMLVSTGRLQGFKACYAQVQGGGDGVVALNAEARALLEVEPGDSVLMAAR
jgi:arginine N-succinyltransferase